MENKTTPELFASIKEFLKVRNRICSCPELPPSTTQAVPYEFCKTCIARYGKLAALAFLKTRFAALEKETRVKVLEKQKIYFEEELTDKWELNDVNYLLYKIDQQLAEAKDE